MIELSVALISYNNDQYISETLNSLVTQKCTFKYEIVVGDDCSTDNTFEIIKSYYNQYPKIFKIQKNSIQVGILKNFKNTIDRCLGKYVFNFDGDDVVKSKYALQKLVDTFNKNPGLGFVDSGYDKYFVSKNLTKPYVNKNTIRASKIDYKNYIFLGKIIPIGACFNRELLLKYVDFETYLEKKISIEDYPTLVDMVANTDFDRIDESLFTYRIHDKSYSFNNGLERYLFLREQMLNLFNYFKIKYNFNKQLCDIYEQKHYKTLLHIAGSYQKKQLGKEVYSKIKSKSIYDIIHYFASQYKSIRYIAKIREFKNLKIQQLRLLFKN